MAYEHIKYEIEDRIARIILNRPERMNAWTATMEREVRLAMEAAEINDDVRVIVLTGEGRAFCAGADIDELANLDPEDIRAEEWMRPFDMNRRPDWQTRYSFYPAIEKPVIAMLNGATAGIGLVHALYCDIRFAADNAVFSTSFARRGLIAEHGLSWMLPHIVGHANALELLLSARKFYAPEAFRMGLVNQIHLPEELEQATMTYARDLANLVSPRAMAVIKRQLYEVPFQTLAEATISANKEMAQSVLSEDFKEGVAHFIEKRAPQFTGR
ncbi:enoyl-CoA hydratase [Hoeflea alexandrii]|uniref:enoyl-CoA hydratase n=1 Tax=Hoeflea alexandrii TaxID=288436 RepID=UPI0022AE9DB1|nr:enoyl-CoA hydratase [Hoeflea alexandrii]MCZ4291687.1 enoyl-CoA hydratase [Hoeflea alexandrii]